MGAARLLASIIHHGLLKRDVDAWQPNLHAGQARACLWEVAITHHVRINLQRLRAFGSATCWRPMRFPSFEQRTMRSLARGVNPSEQVWTLLEYRSRAGTSFAPWTKRRSKAGNAKPSENSLRPKVFPFSPRIKSKSESGRHNDQHKGSKSASFVRCPW